MESEAIIRKPDSPGKLTPLLLSMGHGMIKMSDGDLVPISRRRKVLVVKMLYNKLF
jgi:hypothetical protein